MENKVSAIIFDYGGVIELSPINLTSSISAILGTTKEMWRKTYLEYNHLTNVGNKEWKEIAFIVARKLGATEEQLQKISGIIDEEKTSKVLNGDLVKLIEKLKGMNFKTAVLSNYTSILREKIFNRGISHFFDEIIISSEEGYQKPSKEIFDIAFKRLEVTAPETIFIDDATSSLRLAKEIGYIPILFEDNDSLKKSLSEILNVPL